MFKNLAIHHKNLYFYKILLDHSYFNVMHPTALSGGPIEGTYELLQIHCHWGEKDDEGSEHTIDGKKFAGEVKLYILYIFA